MKRVFLVLSLFAASASAQWVSNGTAVCDTSANSGIEPLSRIATDDNGGAFVCWRDIRNGTYDIYAQHLDSYGKSSWQRNGIPIAVAANNQDFPRIISDGKHGVFIAWEDSRSNTNTYVYAQRLNASGIAEWQQNGIKVSEAGGLFISIANCDSDGLLAAWNFLNGASRDDIVVQRLNGLGTRMWGDSGVFVTNRSSTVSSNDVCVVSDGTQGAIVAWIEGGNVYVQKVDSGGHIRWQDDGELLSDSLRSAFGVAISPDGQMGAIVNWNYADGSGAAQRVNPSGAVLWNPNGVSLPVSGSGGVRRNNSDGVGGAFIGDGLYIQHFDSLGHKLWGQMGVPYFDTLGTTNSCQVPDGNQGVYNFTEAQNLTGALGGASHVRVQWIDKSGLVRFGEKGMEATNGIVVANQFWPAAIEDGSGGAIACWDDFRNGYAAIFAAHFDTNGIVTGLDRQRSTDPESFQLEQNYPNPFNPSTTIEYLLPDKEHVTIKIFDSIGREIITLINEYQMPGVHKINWKGVDSQGHKVSSGIYYYQLVTKSQIVSKKAILIK